MAVIKEDGKLVDSNYIDENYKGRSVLLAFNGEKLPIELGYLVYSSDATTYDEGRADQLTLMNLLANELKFDGVLSSGWEGIDELCIL